MTFMHKVAMASVETSRALRNASEASNAENAGKPPIEGGIGASASGPEEEPPFNVTGFILDYEAGELDNDEIIAGFQHLINSDRIRSLQGSYGRTAQALIDAGLCHP